MPHLPTGTSPSCSPTFKGNYTLAQKYPAALPALLGASSCYPSSHVSSTQWLCFPNYRRPFCVAFHTAPDALNAALEAQRALLREPWAPVPLQIRMGINTGSANAVSPDPVAGRYTGYATIAHVQQVMSTAYGGQILLSNRAPGAGTRRAACGRDPPRPARASAKGLSPTPNGYGKSSHLICRQTFRR